MRQLPLSVHLPDHAVFESFHAGANAACVEHLRRLAVTSGPPGAYVWGSRASGKTHLLYALCASADANQRRAAYLPLARAAECGRAALLEGWETCDVVCVDDLQAVAGQGDWERSLFELFNRLHDGGGAFVVTADRPPRALPLELPDLRSRLLWGGAFALQPLPDEDRLAALRLRASHRGLELPEEVGSYLLKRAPRDMSSLYQLLDSLDREALAAQRYLTVPFVRKILGAPSA
ncbi:DnaA inactivator Hda [soil metagenome]